MTSSLPCIRRETFVSTSLEDFALNRDRCPSLEPAVDDESATHEFVLLHHLAVHKVTSKVKRISSLICSRRGLIISLIIANRDSVRKKILSSKGSYQPKYFCKDSKKKKKKKLIQCFSADLAENLKNSRFYNDKDTFHIQCWFFSWMFTKHKIQYVYDALFEKPSFKLIFTLLRVTKQNYATYIFWLYHVSIQWDIKPRLTDL